MKVIEKYDIRLERLTIDKIEMIRQWRNDPKISQYMEFRQEITSEMQLKWFRSIDNENNLYYIIVYNGLEIGLINIKDIDLQKKSGESGVFIYENKFLNSDISYRAHLCLFDYYFQQLGFEELHAHILESNHRAQRFCEYLGYKQVAPLTYSLLKDDYFENKNRLRFIKKYTILKNRRDE